MEFNYKKAVESFKLGLLIEAILKNINFNIQPKTIRTIYWIITIIFSLFMLMDGIGGITRQQAGQDVLKHLGYPMYALTIFGVAKVLGALTILQTKFYTIKEWAFAGFAFNFIGAAASRAFAGDGFGLIVMPIVVLAFMFVAYYFWKRYEKNKSLG